MELRHLRYLLVAAEEENFHRAAERLHISQPALSRRIRDLEEELGFHLFDRRLKRVHISRAGRVFVDTVKRAMADLQTARAEGARVAKGQSGTLAVGFYESLIARYPGVARSFREFRGAHPGVELRLNAINPAHGIDALLRGEIDAAFVFNVNIESDQIRNLFIGSESWIVAIPQGHPLATREPLLLSDLRAEPFIWSRRELNPISHDELIAACRSAGFAPNIIQSAGSERTKVHLVAAGMGLSFVLSGARTVDDVIYRQVRDLHSMVKADLVWRQDNMSAQLSNFIELVRDQVAPKGSPD